MIHYDTCWYLCKPYDDILWYTLSYDYWNAGWNVFRLYSIVQLVMAVITAVNKITVSEGDQWWWQCPTSVDNDDRPWCSLFVIRISPRSSTKISKSLEQLQRPVPNGHRTGQLVLQRSSGLSRGNTVWHFYFCGNRVWRWFSYCEEREVFGAQSLQWAQWANCQDPCTSGVRWWTVRSSIHGSRCTAASMSYPRILHVLNCGRARRHGLQIHTSAHQMEGA